MKIETKERIKEKLLKLALMAVGMVLFAIVTVVFSGGETKLYKQNEAVKYEGAEYKIIKIEKEQHDLYEEYNNFKVTIKITNTSKETVKYSDMNYYLVNINGEEVTKPGLAVDDGTYLENGSLKPGESIKGVISWIVKKDAEDLRIRYYKSLFSKDNEYEFQWALEN